MAIYHLEAKVVSRGAGRSAVAASAYLSCSRLYNDYDGIFNTIVGFISQSEYVSVLKSEIQEIQWEVDDVLKSKDNASVILSFNYDDKLVGTIELSMVREDGEWKIDGLEFPEFDKINW